MTLAGIIIQRIQTHGPITFRDFMEMALYYPGMGYYTSEGEKIGADGDFYTSPSYTSIFGRLIARQLIEMWERLGMQCFTIVEYGAGTGRLCQDVLRELQLNNEMYEKSDYCIIEKSKLMQKKEKEIINCNKVTWYNDISELPPFTGCILSNELVDNFSVHQVIMHDELMEVFVGYDNGFFEELRPADAQLKDYLVQLNVSLPRGFRAEINLDAIKWIAEVGAAIKRGFVLTIDYGYPSASLYQQGRNDGTIVCYHQHCINYCPYINIGSQDITAHVNFSALHHWGLKNGLEFGGFTSQAHFLLGLGLAAMDELADGSHKVKRFVQTFLNDMGRKFKILIQYKGMERPMLSGLQFSQPIQVL